MSLDDSDVQNVMNETASSNIANQYFIRKMNGPECKYNLDNIKITTVDGYE